MIKYLVPEYIESSYSSTIERQIARLKMNRDFSEEDYITANNQMKKCPTSLAIRETQMKTTIKHHFTLSWMTIIKMTPSA
jgi:hypothetical protein